VTEAHGHSHDWALAACFLGVIAWSCGPLMVRGITAPVAAFTFVRLVVSVPVMGGSAAIAGHRLTLSVFRGSLVPGIFFFLSMATGFTSFQHTSIANATLISSMQPVLMLLVAPRLFGEKPTALRVLLSAVALGGVSMVVLGAASDGEASLDGDLFAVANLVTWSAYFVFAKQARDKGVHPSAFLAGTFTTAAILGLPWVLIAWPDFGAIGEKDLLLIAGQVFVSGLFGHTLMTWCARFLDITLVSLINLLSPAISMAGAWLIYDQSMRAVQVVGATVMLGSIAFVVATRSTTVVRADEGLLAD